MSQKLSKSNNVGIYDYDDRIKRTLALIHKELSPENIEIIEQYQNVMITESLANATILKHLQTLLNLSRFLNKDWKDAKKKDIDSIVARVVQTYSDNGQETNTTHDHKKILKIFFRWLKLDSRDKNEVGDPPETKGIRLKRVKDKIVREDLLDEDDRTKLLHACGENARDRAFIDCHLEAGTRPGEILNLQIKHVKFDKYGAVIHVDGKTGARPIRLIKSTPNLASWLNVHPLKENPSAPLWIILTKKRYGELLSYPAARQMVNRRCQLANLSKRVHLNLFRHSEATNSAKFMTEAQMKKRHGWTPESKMAARYVHLVNADVDAAIFEHLGIETKETEEKNLPKICQICQVPNSSDAEMCSKCGKPLDLQTAIAKEEESQKDKEEQNKKMEEIQFNLQQLQVEVGILRRNARSDEKSLRTANTILYKNQDKILGLDMKPADQEYFLKDKNVEKNYSKIYETDSYAFEVYKQSKKTLK